MGAPAIKARLGSLSDRIGSLVRAIEESDEAKIEAAVLRISGSRRAFRPLVFAVGAIALLFDGLRLLIRNWRLMLVQVLPAVWVWAAMADLRIHLLHDHSFTVLRGPVLIPIILAITAITVASFFLNAVFAFAISQPGDPQIRPAVAEARRNWKPIVASGAVVGLLLGLSTTVVTRWGSPWFALSLGIVTAVMMVCYVSVPARLIGAKPVQTRREKLTTSIVSGALGVTVSTPPWLLGRIGLLMVGTPALLIPGIVLLAVAVPLQAGATGAVRAIKMSASLTGGRQSPEGGVSPRAGPPTLPSARADRPSDR